MNSEKLSSECRPTGRTEMPDNLVKAVTCPDLSLADTHVVNPRAFHSIKERIYQTS